MKKFKAYESIDYDNYTCPSTLSNIELSTAHNDLMECPINVSFWRELDSEMEFRVDEEVMEWPY